MSTFPTAVDSFPTLADGVDTPLAAHQNDRAQGIVAVETKVGVDGESRTGAHHEGRLKNLEAAVTIAATAPAIPTLHDIWVDTTTTPYVEKVWDGAAWQLVGSAGGSTLIVQDEGTARPVQPALNFRGVGVSVSDDAAHNRTNVDITSGTGGPILQDEGTPLAARGHVNFAGGGVAATDDAGNDATLVTIPGITVQEEASGLTQRATLNFIGPGVTAVDNSGSARTDITIPGPAIQSSGVDVPNRGKLNIGGAVSIIDDGANDRTNITITGGGGGGGLIIEDESSPMTSRGILAFEGDGVGLADDSGGGRTVVQIPGLSVYDEGGLAGGPVNILNFVGAGVVASVTGANATITVAGGGGGGGGGANGFTFTKPVIAGTGGPGGAWSTFNPGSPACITITDTAAGILLGNGLNGVSDPANPNWRGMSVPISWPPASGWAEHFGLRLPYQGSTPAPGPLYAVGFSDGTHVWATVIEWNSTGGGPCWDINIRKISALDGTGETNVGASPFHLTAPQPTLFWRLQYDGTNGHAGFNAGEGEQYFCEDNFNTTTEGWTPNKLVVIMRAKNSSGPISTTLRHWDSAFPSWV